MLINDNYIPTAWGISLISLCLSSVLVFLILMTQAKKKLSSCCRDHFWDPTLQTHHQNIQFFLKLRVGFCFNSSQLLLTSVNRMLGCIQGSCSVHRGCSYWRKAFGQPDLRKNGMVTLIRSYPCFGLAAYSKSYGWASHFPVSKPLGCYNLQSPSINANPNLHVSMMSTFNLKSLTGPLGLNQKGSTTWMKNCVFNFVRHDNVIQMWWIYLNHTLIMNIPGRSSDSSTSSSFVQDFTGHPPCTSPLTR